MAIMAAEGPTARTEEACEQWHGRTSARSADIHAKLRQEKSSLQGAEERICDTAGEGVSARAAARVSNADKSQYRKERGQRHM
jgi:hypothetical protein